MADEGFCGLCNRALARNGAHGCNTSGLCGADESGCFDCLLDCAESALRIERDENEALRSNYDKLYARCEQLYAEAQRLHRANAELAGGSKAKHGHRSRR